MSGPFAQSRQRRIGHQSIEKCALTLQQLRASLRHTKPGNAIDLGELPHPARAVRPFQLKGVAARVGDVEVRLDGEGGDNLAARLFQRAEVEDRKSTRLNSSH